MDDLCKCATVHDVDCVWICVCVCVDVSVSVWVLYTFSMYELDTILLYICTCMLSTPFIRFRLCEYTHMHIHTLVYAYM